MQQHAMLVAHMVSIKFPMVSLIPSTRTTSWKFTPFLEVTILEIKLGVVDPLMMESSHQISPTKIQINVCLQVDA